jgi:hypothetical protein
MSSTKRSLASKPVRAEAQQQLNLKGSFSGTALLLLRGAEAPGDVAQAPHRHQS